MKTNRKIGRPRLGRVPLNTTIEPITAMWLRKLAERNVTRGQAIDQMVRRAMGPLNVSD